MKKDDQPSTEVTALIAAWQRLYPDPDKPFERRGNAGARAQLRRAGSPAEVELEPAFHALLRDMKDCGHVFPVHASYRRLALVAGLLACRPNGRSRGQPLMQVLGGKGEPSEHRLKPLRFQSVISALDREDEAEIMTALRRALLMARDDALDLHAFARDVLHWGEEARRRWTYHYFGYPHHSDQTEPTETPSEESPA